MFVLILDLVEDFHTVEERRLHRIFCGLYAPYLFHAYYTPFLCTVQADNPFLTESYAFFSEDKIVFVSDLLPDQAVATTLAR